MLFKPSKPAMYFAFSYVGQHLPCIILSRFFKMNSEEMIYPENYKCDKFQRKKHPGRGEISTCMPLRLAAYNQHALEELSLQLGSKPLNSPISFIHPRTTPLSYCKCAQYHDVPIKQIYFSFKQNSCKLLLLEIFSLNVNKT